MININELTRVQRHLVNVEAPILRIERRMTACVMDLNAAFHALWSLPDAEIEEIVNTMGLEWFEGLLTQHATHAAMFNQILEGRGITSQQAITGMPREFTVDETGFHLVPRPEPEVVDLPVEPEVIPEPEPGP